MWYYPKKHLFQDNSNSYDMFHYDSWISECQLLSSYYLHEFIICRIKSTAIVDCKTIRGGWKFKEAVNIFVGLILAYSRKSPLYIFLNRNWVYKIFFRKNFVLVLFKCAKPGRIIRTLITQRFRDFEILRVNGGRERERGGGSRMREGKRRYEQMSECINLIALANPYFTKLLSGVVLFYMIHYFIYWKILRCCEFRFTFVFARFQVCSFPFRPSARDSHKRY